MKYILKTLHLAIIAILLITILFPFNTIFAQLLPAGPAIDFSTSKIAFVDGEIIPISGHTIPNSMINIFLVDNYGNIENSTQVKSDYSGSFHANLGIPSHVIGGGWYIVAKSDEGNWVKEIMVNTHGVSIMTLHIPSDLPPLKQFKLGTLAKDVKCENDLQLVVKAEDGSPACVKPDTAQKLIERGWAKEPVESHLDSIQNVSVASIKMIPPYNPGGPTILMYLQNTGIKPVTSLKAVLQLNNNYTFYFKDVTYSLPLTPDSYTSDTETLIGGGFQTQLEYPIIISGIVDNVPFRYTEYVHIHG